MYRNIVSKIRRESDWGTDIILFTWDENGNPSTEVYDFEPSLMYEGDGGTVPSIFGTPLIKKKFHNNFQRRQFVDARPSVRFFEHDRVERQFLQQKFWQENENSDFDRFNLRIHILDIEIAIEDEFPEPDKAAYPINMITVYDTHYKKFFTWAVGEAKPFRDDAILNICKNESELIHSYVDWHSKNYPDVLSGWNTMSFDLTYIMNRFEQIIGEMETKKMSPVGSYYRRVKMISDRPVNTVTIDGISHLDYLLLYRDKFKVQNLFNYKLDTVGEAELGLKKLSHDGKFKDFYKQHFQKFYEYNVRDVEIVVKLDEKVKLIRLARKICNLGLCEYESIYSSIPYIYSALKIYTWKSEWRGFPSSNLESDKEHTEYEGAYVKPPIVGMYRRGLTSLDLNSLYPNTMIALNLSPETKVGRIIAENSDDTLILKTPLKEVNLTRQQYQKLIDDKCTIAANKVLYTKPNVKKGIVPMFLEHVYSGRKAEKKRMVDLKKLISKRKSDPSHTEDELNKLSEERERADLIQQGYKTVMNSLYGIMASKFCPIFDIDNAEAITKTGQVVIKESMDFINKYFKEKYASASDVTCYGDTDSFFSKTIIRTNAGLFMIEDLFNMMYAAHQKDFVITNKGNEIIPFTNIQVATVDSNMNNNDVKFKSPGFIIRHKVTKKKYRIKYHEKEVIVTEDHSCMVLRDNKLIKIKPAEINSQTDKLIIIE